VTTGIGNDTVQVYVNYGHVTVTDFDPRSDVLDVQWGTTAHATDVSAGVLISWAEGQDVFLQAVKAAQLTAANVHGVTLI
jgi:hypothetical protein